MNKSKALKVTKELKNSVDEIYDELRTDSPRIFYLRERIKHLRPQIENLEESTK